MRGFGLFTLAGVPVAASPWFVLLLFFMFGGEWLSGFIWVAAIAVSILVHEFGHALVAKHFRLSPSILLHGFGGLCFHERAETDRDDALIVIAGPSAGLALGSVVALVAFGVDLAMPSLATSSPNLGYAVKSLLIINLGWSLVNLLPLWPLDGGQLFRLAMVRMLQPARAEKIVHGVSLGVCGAAAVGLTVLDWGLFMYVIVGFLAYQNIQALRGATLSGAVRSRDRSLQDLLQGAQQAVADERWQEAVLTCHQVRAASNPGPKILGEVWTLLGLSNARMGKYREALTFLKRAPASRQVAALNRECLEALGMEAELAEIEKRQRKRAIGGQLKFVFAAALVLFIAGGAAGASLWFGDGRGGGGGYEMGTLTGDDGTPLTAVVVLATRPDHGDVSRLLVTAYRGDDAGLPALLLDARLDPPLSGGDLGAVLGEPLSLSCSTIKPGRLTATDGSEPLVVTGGTLTLDSAHASANDRVASSQTAFRSWDVTGVLALEACERSKTPCRGRPIKFRLDTPVTVAVPTP